MISYAAVCADSLFSAPENIAVWIAGFCKLIQYHCSIAFISARMEKDRSAIMEKLQEYGIGGSSMFSGVELWDGHAVPNLQIERYFVGEEDCSLLRQIYGLKAVQSAFKKDPDFIVVDQYPDVWKELGFPVVHLALKK